MFEIGNTLREARLRRGLDILDCEAETKIRAKYLRAMEEEQFDLMPSPTYVRGFLRTYADFLDLDGRLVLDEYESRFGTYRLSGDRDGPARARPGGAPEPVRRRSPSEPRGVARPRRRRRTEVQLLWLAIGGVMAVALLIWMGVGDNSPQPAISDPSAATGARTLAQVAEPDTAATEAPVKTKKTTIVLTGTGTYGCYVEVRGKSSKGRLVVQRILAPGESVTFKVLDGIWVRATNPAELAVTIAGKAASLNSSVHGAWLITTHGVKRAS
jgi:cytoskeletal protein RodZ